ncbi:hypothetical protein J2Q11_12340 [Tenacibaculum finnmarkense genomovar finnmarkense]|uniref:hypothetical protein n=1 Tax=Tenacibaculum finnmarkense TaxID=2781243 RepID=UPI001EFB3CEB|nr:hypothetical protein [Tenacibaculum finnmarkense]MCG8213586.1 hypothetical protein [Tenacibaculum finnmarkense genomovar finnmarkense]MCG8231919.1 hypothetical protein [Tenacibaculum finnmarkense genomovar finnmarkense]MCG8886467.1 hypothetical protein [Tenacibaculum finnmarkense]MCG8897249.1 hypothetical protein [Tenacibaculum finnmarkense]MCG8903973.1 hypothetical protein [Tenacibaculum finnmarkense]
MDLQLDKSLEMLVGGLEFSSLTSLKSKESISENVGARIVSCSDKQELMNLWCELTEKEQIVYKKQFMQQLNNI